jgi:hypothetical protein
MIPPGDETQVDALAKDTAENPNDKLLDDLRVLEKKMGLVLTLVSLSSNDRVIHLLELDGHHPCSST